MFILVSCATGRVGKARCVRPAAAFSRFDFMRLESDRRLSVRQAVTFLQGLPA